MIDAVHKIEIGKMAVSELMGLTDLLSIQSLAHIYLPRRLSLSPCRQAGKGRGTLFF